MSVCVLMCVYASKYVRVCVYKYVHIYTCMHARVCGAVRTSKQLSCARLATHRQRSDGRWDWTFELMKRN